MNKLSETKWRVFTQSCIEHLFFLKVVPGMVHGLACAHGCGEPELRLTGMRIKRLGKVELPTTAINEWISGDGEWPPSTNLSGSAR